jgi:hypothetical protein
MLGSSRVAAQLAASREGLGSMSDDDDYISLCVIPSFSRYVIKPHAVSCDGPEEMHFCSLHSCHFLPLTFSVSIHMKSICTTSTLRSLYIT